MGKTTMLCGLAISLALEHQDQVVFLNTDVTLLFRDYKRVSTMLDKHYDYLGR